ncbi:fructose-6-phosphate aldolase [Aquibacillus halophilus]|uniref:Fructose-6-phosphate aldolase n=1 Tax=Aquibacillus halophilus TaxID=930132 RepID=A0A6A8DID3_9BACI|nr:transaldolase family protein [Aquibacillus halophilus]MRH41072.1 fructose-6-phosphate aldolase [Aquibacillus halophilus]
MEFYLDTANTEEVKKASRLAFLDGITTNPSIIAKEKVDFKTKIQEIATLIDGKVWCQATGSTADAMYDQAIEMNSWGKKMVIKLPMNFEGLVAAGELVKKDVEVNMTLVNSLSHVVLAAKAGVTYISPYVGRTDDQSFDGQRFIREALQTIENLKSPTKVIGASIRGPQIAVDLANAGIDAITMSFDTFEKMVQSPLTDLGLAQFTQDWTNYMDDLKGN